MRGEDKLTTEKVFDSLETPPRAWGRLFRKFDFMGYTGNTPTCVGKTAQDTKTLLDAWKHPHVRGED